MNDPWIRVPPERSDDAKALIAAGALAAGVGLITFYLTRMVLARERLSGGGPPGRDEDAAGEGGGA